MSNPKYPFRPIDTIDSRHIMSMILFISEYGPSRRTDIYENVSRNATMTSKIQCLIERGIIAESESSRGMVLSLTDSGMEIARCLAEIEGHIDRTY